MIHPTLKSRLLSQLHFGFVVKWLLIALIVGGLAGSASAVFLIALEWAGNFRGENIWIIALLPIAGLIVAGSYHYFGKSVAKGNNQLIEEVTNPDKPIPFKMAPLVLIGTVLTHLFGGSAGREGTAVQMGGAIADQFTKLFKFDKDDRRILIICGISAGFASVFGTPLAGTVFALEILVIGKVRYNALIPSLFSAVIANYVCDLWPIHHTHYSIDLVPELTLPNLGLAIVAGILFGWAAMGFSAGIENLSAFLNKHFKKWFIKPVLGGIVVAGLGWVLGIEYLGLGVPKIVESFTTIQDPWAFAIKLGLTVITLSTGFKGGEVTPLFFIGATLGSALSAFFPLPTALLAGMGFVAVFSGAANAPIACSLMGIELFGAEAGVYITIACLTAYFFSGHTGIYNAQVVEIPKHPKRKDEIGRNVGG